MRVNLELSMDTDWFDTSEAAKAEELAEITGGRVYTWKTIGKHNWLERGFHIIDALGLVVLPQIFPDEIKMLDDSEEEGVDG